MTQLRDTHEILKYDIDPDYLRDVSVGLGWVYSDLFREMEAMKHAPEDIKTEAFGRLRGPRVVDMLVGACKRHSIPFGFRRLDCNGQQKLLIKAGRVLMIQEPILQLGDRPRTSDYKMQLASAHGLAQQLELDLGDIPNRILDWSGKVLAVLLHGSCAAGWNESDRSLGGTFLAVPNYAYDSWVMRLDLQRLAENGFDAGIVGLGAPKPKDSVSYLPDNVHVRLKSLPVEKGNTA